MQHLPILPSELNNGLHQYFCSSNGCGLRPGQPGRNEVSLDRICVNFVVHLGQSALKTPSQRSALSLFLFQALEFFDQIKLELRTQPRAELKRNVFVGKGAPYRPALASKPIAPVASIHFLADR